MQFPRCLPTGAVLVATCLSQPLYAQKVISGNEGKIELTPGAPTAVDEPHPDSISIIDFAQLPPQVTHTMGINNTVIGPPSNVAILSGGKFALLANSITMDADASPDPWVANDELHLLDISSDPIQIVTTAHVGKQPSGLSVTPDGNLVLVANRAAGTVSVVKIDRDRLHVVSEVPVAKPEDSVSDVAIHPNGKLALVSVQKGGYLALLTIEGDVVTATSEKFSVCGQPYRVIITPDGALGLTAGAGPALNGVDIDALTIVDLQSTPRRTIDYVAIGSVPESIEISPDGEWVAAVLMAGSNFPAADPRHSPAGQVALLKRKDKTFELRQQIPIGRIPEGVVFTSDGKYLLAQCHADRNIHVLKMTDQGAEPTTIRIEVPGFPSSLRAAPSK